MALRRMLSEEDCPEDCREAVASLMFAAARFSDLPELRELRDLFQGKYGSSVEYYVNQKLVENISLKPPSMEKKVQLLEQITSEFSLRWDSRGFEERMANSSVTEQRHQQSPDNMHAAQSRVSTPFAEETVPRTFKDEVLPKKRNEATYKSRERQVDDGFIMENKRDGVLDRKDELKHNAPKTPELANDRYKPSSFRKETFHKREEQDNSFQRREKKDDRCVSEENSAKEAFQVSNSSNGKRLESAVSQNKLYRHRLDNEPDRDFLNTFSQQRPDQRAPSNGVSSTPSINNEPAEDNYTRSTKKKQEDVTDGLKSNFRGGVPPPYVKPRKSKHKVNTEENDTLTSYPAGNSKRPEKPPTIPNSPDAHEDEVDMGRFTEVYYKDESSVESTPKRRSHRKKPSRSASIQDSKVNGDMEKEERVIRRVSTSRRKHGSRKGLQILFDDDHYQKDDEEKVIDKLLLHYSKKPSSSDTSKPRRETKNKSSNARKSPVHKPVAGNNLVEEDSTPRRGTSRSMSFPPRQVTQPEPHKVFARAASFQQEIPAKHVHPKLPDYDDLAARFAALRASKD
ncbi:IST1-like protein [Bienertia sinuspersici]